MKKLLSILLAAMMLLSVLSACGTNGGAEFDPTDNCTSPIEDEIVESTPEIVDTKVEQLPNLMVMSGPTGVGAAKLIEDQQNVASVVVAADNEEVKNALINGDADIAAVATNVASALYNKTDGAIKVLAVNTLGVLYILEKGETIQNMADLDGKTIYATGQGANPEYILNYLLEKSGVSPENVDIQWMTAQEVIGKMTTGESGICMLPVPAVTTLMMKDSGIRQAISLTEVWDLVGEGALAQGCIVARTDYIQENPQAVRDFLTAYAASLAFMTDENNRDEASALVAKYGITANEQIAAKALPDCNLTFIDGQEMKTLLENFYQIMFEANPASIGGALPGDDFYYGE